MTSTVLAKRSATGKWMWRSVIAGELFLVAAVFIYVARLDPDPQHDGTQLGTAVGVSEGLLVHKDVFSQYGPIGPWLNGVIMYIFGPQLLTIRIASAIQLVLLNVLIYLTARTLNVVRSLALIFSFVWALSCPV